MCGIAVDWGCSRGAVQRMLNTMGHRGPDGEGVSTEGNAVMGHRRLAIIDLLGGDQPLRNETGSHTLVANGEIYNAASLRRELERNHTFRTRSDNEMILHLYEDFGPRCVTALDGMFAFALADGDHLFAARDPLGIKPLYYGRTERGWLFASEIKALTGEVAEIREFPPGSWFRTDVGFQSYPRVPQPVPTCLAWQEHATRLRCGLENAVRKRLMADVPVGVFLSGGLDSSIIAALAAREIDGLKTFSVGVADSPDLLAAREVAKHLGTRHYEVELTAEEVVAHLPRVIYHLESFDRDLVRSAIPCYFVSRLASEHVKVVLSGEGADELFAGYAYYRAYEDPVALDNELRRSVQSLHNINLQRVDRMTMAHSIEGRVPFLDFEVTEAALSIPPQLKLRGDGSKRPTDKWILRKACEDLLPADIVWRKKQQFDEGSGTVDLLCKSVLRFFTDQATQEHVAQHPEVSIRGKEEAVYHQILWSVFDDPRAVQAVVARWSEGRIGL